ncbi:MAG: diphosphomevalonate decarboxylase [Myxococcales bacterium]|nr:diphosphomevalonate decarboxylase [Myxococcales bacterium]
MKRVRAVAYSNIALAKYWGKADVAENLPATPSLSLTLGGLRTLTEVTFDTALEHDEAWLGTEPLSGRPLARVVALLDRVRAKAGLSTRANVISRNDFPTAAGLASSASGFAALALSASSAAGLELSLEELSALARASSASAARSLFGGYASLAAGARSAERVASAEHFPLSMVVTLTARGPKSVGSTEGMQHTASTSPYYPAWVAHAPALFEEVRRGVLERDIERLGTAMEQSALMMHASMFAARPAVIYLLPTTLAVMTAVKTLREGGVPAYYTMDAGPHVKVLTLPEHSSQVSDVVSAVPGVERTLISSAGPDAHTTDEDPRGEV